MRRHHLKIPFLIVVSFLLSQSCVNTSEKNLQKKDTNQAIVIRSENEADNQLKIEVLNQTIQTIIDSLNNRIRIDLGDDYINYKIIHIADTLCVSNDLFDLRKACFSIDTTNWRNEVNLKLEFCEKNLKNGKTLVLVSSFEEYAKNVNNDPSSRILLFFYGMHFNDKQDQAVFSFWMSSSPNSGEEYTVCTKKLGDKWTINSFLETAVR